MAHLNMISSFSCECLSELPVHVGMDGHSRTELGHQKALETTLRRIIEHVNVLKSDPSNLLVRLEKSRVSIPETLYTRA